MILFFFSLRYMSVGAAVTLRYTSPLFVALLAVFLLKEKIKHLQWIFFILAFIGVLMVKGFDPTVDFYGFTIILICAFFSAIVYLLISKIGKGDHPVIIIHYFMFLATLVGAIGCFFDWKTPVGIEWVLLLSLGIVGFFAQIFMTKALQIGPAFQIAPLKYAEVVFSVLFGLLFFQELYNFYSLMGVFLIIMGLVFNLIYKSKQKQTFQK
jgi:drug/metabolite transporter (DMT)-like permease